MNHFVLLNFISVDFSVLINLHPFSTLSRSLVILSKRDNAVIRRIRFLLFLCEHERTFAITCICDV